MALPTTDKLPKFAGSGDRAAGTVFAVIARPHGVQLMEPPGAGRSRGAPDAASLAVPVQYPPQSRPLCAPLALIGTEPSSHLLETISVCGPRGERGL